MKKVLSLSTAGLLSCYLPVAQGIELYNDEETSLDFKGNMSVYYLQSGDAREINDGFSRYLFDLKHNLDGGWQALAMMEWGIQVSKTGEQLYIGNNNLTSTGPSADTTWLRQGYVGVSHETYGTLTIGKQWGTSYDVAGVTDVFDIFGAQAQGTYNLGTDGGFSGTGRAEQSVKYKLNYKSFTFGAQFLASNNVVSTEDIPQTPEEPELPNGIKFNDSYGMSVIYRAPFDIGLGFAYNKAEVSLVADLNPIAVPVQSGTIDDEIATAHITYRNLGDLGFHAAIVYTDMKNHELNDAGRLMEKSEGVELYSAYRFDNDISLVVGYNSLKDNSNTLTPEENSFHLKHYIVGAKYHLDDDAYFYVEGKIDDSTTATVDSTAAENAIGIGMMFSF